MLWAARACGHNVDLAGHPAMPPGVGVGHWAGTYTCFLSDVAAFLFVCIDLDHHTPGMDYPIPPGTLSSSVAFPSSVPPYSPLFGIGPPPPRHYVNSLSGYHDRGLCLETSQKPHISNLMGTAAGHAATRLGTLPPPHAFPPNPSEGIGPLSRPSIPSPDASPCICLSEQPGDRPC